MINFIVLDDITDKHLGPSVYLKELDFYSVTAILGVHYTK